MLRIWWRQFGITKETGCPERETRLSVKTLTIIEADVGFVNLRYSFAFRSFDVQSVETSLLFG
jgi:hypothetical protein